MNCDCQETKLIPSCTDNLQIGFIDDLSTLVFIFVKNLTTGYIQQFSATSSAQGLVTLDMTTEPNYFQPKQQFELWVTLQSTTQKERLDVKIVDFEFPCFLVEFEKINDSSGLVDYTNHELQLNSEFTRIEPIIWLDSTQGVVTETGNTNVTRWENLGTANDFIQSTTMGGGLPNLEALNVAVDFDREGLELTDFEYSRTYFHWMGVFNNEDVATLRYIMSHYSTPNDISWRVGVNGANGRFTCEVRQSVANGKEYTIDDIDVNGAYVLGEFVFDNGDFKLFVNNIPFNNSQTEDDTVTTLLDATVPLVIGGDLAGITLQNEFDGKVKEIKIFNQALSATQRQQEVLELIAKL